MISKFMTLHLCSLKMHNSVKNLEPTKIINENLKSFGWMEKVTKSAKAMLLITTMLTMILHLCSFSAPLSAQLTPLGIENAQSASSSSLITAPEGGVLNVRRCKPFLFDRIECLVRPYQKLLLTEFHVNSQVPDDINLSNNINSKLIINKALILDPEKYKDEIDRVKTEYNNLKQKKNLHLCSFKTPTPWAVMSGEDDADCAFSMRNGVTSDFIVDVFTERINASHKFSVTRFKKSSEKTKTAIYLSGNNDYFYNKDMANKLKDKGYNFYAISFPNFGFTSNVDDPNYSTFDNMDYLFQYIDLVVDHYNLAQVDILLGHSTGGLIAIMYANYRNKNQTFVKSLFLSSPFLDWFGNPNPTSFIEREELFEYIITPLSLFIPKMNLKSSKGQPNYTTCEEFNRVNFNPEYKSLVEIHIFPEFIRACTLAQQEIQKGRVNVNCEVDILFSDKSVFWDYSETEDNILDVEDIVKYGPTISSKKVTLHKIKNSVHSCFLHPDANVLLNQIIE